jgi:hypothetical protein
VSKEDFQDIVSLLPDNAPLPASEKMKYILARLEVSRVSLNFTFDLLVPGYQETEISSSLCLWKHQHLLHMEASHCLDASTVTGRFRMTKCSLLVSFESARVQFACRKGQKGYAPSLFCAPVCF